MKKYFLIGLLLSAGSANAQIPTTDEAAIAQTALEHVLQATRAAEAVTARAAQLTQLQNQFNSITGTRNLGGIFDNPLLKQSLPAGWSGAMDATTNAGYAGMNAITAAEYNQIYDACGHLSGQSKINCEAYAVQGARDRAVAKQGLANTDLRLAQLDQLMAQINSTTDTKGIQELSARIAVEQARIATDQLKLNQFNLSRDANERILAQQISESRAAKDAGFTPTSIPTEILLLY